MVACAANILRTFVCRQGITTPREHIGLAEYMSRVFIYAAKAHSLPAKHIGREDDIVVMIPLVVIDRTASLRITKWGVEVCVGEICGFALRAKY